MRLLIWLLPAGIAAALAWLCYRLSVLRFRDRPTGLGRSLTWWDGFLDPRHYPPEGVRLTGWARVCEVALPLSLILAGLVTSRG